MTHQLKVAEPVRRQSCDQSIKKEEEGSGTFRVAHLRKKPAKTYSLKQSALPKAGTAENRAKLN